MWKWIVGVFLVCVLVCGVGGYFVATNKEIRKQIDVYLPQSKPTEVRLSAVSKGELSRTVSAPGQVEPKTSVKISAQVSARIVALPFRENDPVKEGDVIVRLDARDLAAALDAARANLQGEMARLEGWQAQLVQADADRARVSRLHKSGDKTEADMEQSEANYLRAKSNVVSSERAIDAAKAQIVRAEKDLENTVVKSPIDGTITTLDAEVGELVVVGTLNNAGSVIMEIADLSHMFLKARVDETNVTPIKEKQNARVYINAYGERLFKGFVERIELQRKLDKDNTGYFEVWIPLELEKGETLRSGLTANTDIEVETIHDALVVPSQAVLDRKVDELPKAVTDDNAYIPKNNTFARVVYRVEDVPEKTTVDGRPIKKVVATPVTVGSSDLTRTVIIGGLKEGEQIVTGPFKVLVTLQHGQEVVEEGSKAKDDKPAAAAPAASQANAGAGGGT